MKASNRGIQLEMKNRLFKKFWLALKSPKETTTAMLLVRASVTILAGVAPMV